MKKIIIIISILITCSCAKKKNIKENLKSGRDTIFIKELSDNSFIYRLTYLKDSVQNLTLEKLEIKQKSKGVIIQQDKLEINEISENCFYFSIDKDINFDGHNDICIKNYEGAYTSTYSYWLYDEKSIRFKHCKVLDEIKNPAIIKDKKELCSSWHSGLSEFHLEKYFWEKDSLILKEKYEESWTDKGYLKTTKLVNNRYIIKDSVIKKNIVMFMKCK